MGIENYIDITGCDLIALVKKAYALSSPQGLGFLHYREGELSDDEAKSVIEQTANARYAASLDYVLGRSVKLRVLKDGDRMMIYKSWYDHSEYQLRELLASIGKELPAAA